MQTVRCLSFAVLAAFAAGSVHAAGAGIAGHYHIHGQNPDGRPYEGALRIEQKGDVYALTWDSGGVTHGVGVLQNGRLVAAYGEPTCGVVAYRTQSDGALQGTWATANSTQTGSETAKRAQDSGGALAGDYLVSGHNMDRTDYKGALFIGETDDGKLSFAWRTGPDSRGFGFRSGDVIAASFGPPSCGVVAYRVGADGMLNGQWSLLRGGIGREETTQRIDD